MSTAGPLVLTGRTTYDCAPGLSDEQVLQFCKDGYLKLEAVVDAETNRRCTEFLAPLGERMSAGSAAVPRTLACPRNATLRAAGTCACSLATLALPLSLSNCSIEPPVRRLPQSYVAGLHMPISHACSPISDVLIWVGRVQLAR